METLEHTDFELRDLWQTLSQLEHCSYELQEVMLVLGNLQATSQIEDQFITGAGFLNSLDRCKELVRVEVVSAARIFCDDSQGFSEGLTSSRIWTMDTTKTSEKFLKECTFLIDEAKTCISDIRLLYETPKRAGLSNERGIPKFEYRHGKWIKTFQGCDLEREEGNDMNEFGRLKRDFDKQTSNILVLEKERNNMSIQIEVMKREKEACKCARDKT